MTQHWWIRLLGPHSVGRGPVELELRSTPGRVILAVLALAGGREVTHRELVDALWGEDRPPSAESNVYTYISGLRQALEPDRQPRATGGVISSSPLGYALEIDCDVHHFRALRANAEEHRKAGRHSVALAQLDSALALWRGEALAGLPGPFAAAQRADLEELRLATAETRAEILLELDRHNEVIPGLTALCREHPLREGLRALLMRALHRGGRTAEALGIFAAGRSALVTASGIEPGTDLRRLHQDLLGGGVGAASSAVPAARAKVFIGRETELKILRSAVDDVLNGHGRTLCLTGEPGIGKTALLAEALTTLPVRVGWGVARENDRPGQVIRDCLGLPDGDTRSPVDVTGRPAILVADDFQHADEVAKGLWRRFAQVPGLLLISSTRARREAIGLELALSPLGESQVRELAARLRDTPVPPDLLASASGNPRYVREIVESEPRELINRIDEHLAFLTAPTRSVLQRAALLGERFTFADLATTVGRPPLACHVEEALAAGILVADGTSLRFRHPVVRSALYGRLPGAMRTALHDQFASALAEAGAPADRVAHHLAHAHG